MRPHARSPRRLLAVAVALMAIAGPATASQASAATYGWRVSGTLTGTYANSYSWVNCRLTGATARFAETASVNLTLRSRAITRYNQVGGTFLSLGRVSGGGTWRQNGTFPPDQKIPGTSDSVCGAPANVTCTGALEIVRAQRQSGDLLLFGRGSAIAGRFRATPPVRESALVRRIGGHPICGQDPVDTSAFSLFYGVGNVAARAWNSVISFPRARLRTRRAFSVSGRRVRPDPDQCEGTYDSCTQSGSMVVKLRFTPAG